MPTYCYSNSDGVIVEQFHKMGDAPAEIVIDGEVCKRDFQAEQVGVPARSGWPLTCYASGVHADDAQKLRDHFTEIGVPTEVTINGDPVYKSPSHRRKALAARGFYDKDSFS